MREYVPTDTYRIATKITTWDLGPDDFLQPTSFGRPTLELWRGEGAPDGSLTQSVAEEISRSNINSYVRRNNGGKLPPGLGYSVFLAGKKQLLVQRERRMPGSGIGLGELGLFKTVERVPLIDRDRG